jgi:hypothetical protein
MNWISAVDAGSRVALVVEGRVRVGCPGAPGWTTTGVFCGVCCAQTGKENRLASVIVAESTCEHLATLNPTWISPVLIRKRRVLRRK